MGTSVIYKKEIFAWAMYDFANSAYTTIVATTIFNPYFVKVIASTSCGLKSGDGTFLLTLTMCISSLLIVVTAPVIGAIADVKSWKKRLLFFATLVCVLSTASLALVSTGDYILAMILLVLSGVSYGTAENLIAAFLPELGAKEDLGKISAFGWAIGYLGGLSSLGLCLTYVFWAQQHKQSNTQYVPITMLITACFYALGALPTFLVLKEKMVSNLTKHNYFQEGFKRLHQTLNHVRHYQDLFRFLVTLFIFTCGTATLIGLASVYAQEVMRFSTTDLIIMIFVVNITAVLGAFGIGFLQDRIGSVKTLLISLSLWIIAIVMAYFTSSRPVFWLAANLIGLALGASGSVGRALVGIFSPPERAGEFFGLWGLACKLAAAVGPLTFGVVAKLTGNNLRISILSTAIFFILGMILLITVNEKRGRDAAKQY